MDKLHNFLGLTGEKYNYYEFKEGVTDLIVNY